MVVTNIIIIAMAIIRINIHGFLKTLPKKGQHLVIALKIGHNKTLLLLFLDQIYLNL